jgi:hypothetical protein
MMNWPSIILWGFVATALLTMLMRGSQALGLTRMDLPFMLGTMFSSNREHAKLYGFLIHLVNAWVFSLLYALLFEVMGYAEWWLGGTSGLIHGLFVLMVALPIIPGLHPRMASEYSGPVTLKPLEPPGFMALNYGKRTPIVILASHILYGTILGLFYMPVSV